VLHEHLLRSAATWARLSRPAAVTVAVLMAMSPRKDAGWHPCWAVRFFVGVATPTATRRPDRSARHPQGDFGAPRPPLSTKAGATAAARQNPCGGLHGVEWGGASRPSPPRRAPPRAGWGSWRARPAPAGSDPVPRGPGRSSCGGRVRPGAYAGTCSPESASRDGGRLSTSMAPRTFSRFRPGSLLAWTRSGSASTMRCAI
jgi:hypothetical protein